jgi:hypothetical protein
MVVNDAPKSYTAQEFLQTVVNETKMRVTKSSL